MKPWLSLDSTGESYSLALWRGPQLLAECSGGQPRQHLVQIFPALDLLCRQSGLKPGELRAVAVTGGPGSFTGVRTGLLLAKTLAQADDLPVYPVDTLEALAANAVEGDSVVAGLDARKGEIIWARYRVRQGLPSLLEPARLSSPQEFLDSIPAGSLVLGSACQAALPGGEEVRVLPADLWRVRAVSVGRVAWPRLQAGAGTSWPQLRPDYVRPADVQVHRG
ncbi:MAG: tRNA (adenosine(37)-N6)-threonylcarbamoyltransferase complex dimerization subunit type 1 TsaB [Candidatus Eremiobacteraeota bacterium]|nr:tRNA (adenosine(37)-N6)-threonylcarbamoyltransferase complex dimerization subunit type 1 TsaB [Candidatus Eremiobacteraeota bacterium]MCW5870240.1 tRNA (adenosine(37)-N6)-threonylcarbamoyltransferase complex dimerization subunit type 1 TsaB [Candidatus Eremiobacteraeota bacterium]